MSRKWVSRVLAAVLPWPSRADRRDSVRAARDGAEVAHAKAAEAAILSQDIWSKRREVLVRNHIGQIIANEFTRGDNHGTS